MLDLFGRLSTEARLAFFISLQTVQRRGGTDFGVFDAACGLVNATDVARRIEAGGVSPQAVAADLAARADGQGARRSYEPDMAEFAIPPLGFTSLSLQASAQKVFREVDRDFA